jgi:hypothetical protein
MGVDLQCTEINLKSLNREASSIRDQYAHCSVLVVSVPSRSLKSIPKVVPVRHPGMLQARLPPHRHLGHHDAEERDWQAGNVLGHRYLLSVTEVLPVYREILGLIDT